MEKNFDKTQEIVIKAIMPCLNKDMQITDDAVANIAIDCKVEKAFQDAMRHVVTWFNKSNVEEREGEDQDRFVGAVINLLTLLAMGDVAALVDNWVLDDMTEKSPE